MPHRVVAGQPLAPARTEPRHPAPLTGCVTLSGLLNLSESNISGVWQERRADLKTLEQREFHPEHWSQR